MNEELAERNFYLVCMTCRTYVNLGTKYSLLSNLGYCRKILRYMFMHVQHKLSIQNPSSIKCMLKSSDDMKLNEVVLDRLNFDSTQKPIEESTFNTQEYALEKWKTGIKKAKIDINSLSKEEIFLTGFNMGFRTRNTE